jgi:hypothetical protein
MNKRNIGDSAKDLLYEVCALRRRYELGTGSSWSDTVEDTQRSVQALGRFQSERADPRLCIRDTAEAFDVFLDIAQDRSPWKGNRRCFRRRLTTAAEERVALRHRNAAIAIIVVIDCEASNSCRLNCGNHMASLYALPSPLFWGFRGAVEGCCVRR